MDQKLKIFFKWTEPVNKKKKTVGEIKLVLYIKYRNVLSVSNPRCPEIKKSKVLNDHWHFIIINDWLVCIYLDVVLTLFYIMYYSLRSLVYIYSITLIFPSFFGYFVYNPLRVFNGLLRKYRTCCDNSLIL